MNEINLSAVVLTKDSELTIANCLRSINFVDEVIVIDDCSQDKTIKIVQEYDCRIFKKNLENDFSKQRNFGISKAQGKWVLFVDSDEIVTKELKNEIIQVTTDVFNSTDGYFLKRRDVFLRNKLEFGEWGKNKFLRLARRKSGKWVRKVHEFWEIEGKKKTLKSELLHYPHTNLHEFINEISFFSSLHTDANFLENKKSTLFKIIFFPKIKFLQNWILRGGFKDGDSGFIISLIMSFHSFLSWSKLWLKTKQNS